MHQSEQSHELLAANRVTARLKAKWIDPSTPSCIVRITERMYFRRKKEQLKVKTEMKMLHWIIGCLTVTQKAE